MSKTKTYEPRGQPSSLRSNFRLIVKEGVPKHSCLIVGEPEILYPAVVFTSHPKYKKHKNEFIGGKTYINNQKDMINSRYIQTLSTMDINDEKLQKAFDKSQEFPFKSYVLNGKLIK